MKRVLIVSILLLFSSTYAKTLKVLAIGNSFSVCVTRNLPQITASVPECRIILTSAEIGGCSLEKHWLNVSKVEAGNPRTYSIVTIDSNDLKKKTRYRGTLTGLLQKNRYDIITIQQNSRNSIDYATCQPYAANLIAFIKKHQPQAEIVIQQTWSYRCDSPQLKQWQIDNHTMYEKLAGTYAKLAKEHGLRMIPAGLAVQLFRAETPVKYVPLSAGELKKFQKPAVPPFSGEVVGKYFWSKGKKNKYETERLLLDAHHLNFHGEYLQAAVWFAFLFDKPVSGIKYFPENIDRAQAEFLLSCAQKAVASFQQPAGK